MGISVILNATNFTNFKQACDNGDAIGCYNLGTLYGSGLKVKQDYFMAVKFFRKACDGQISMGCYNLGVSYERGQGVQQDYTKAKELFSKACIANQAIACYNLGEMYANGRGVAKNNLKAIELFKKACSGEIAEGCYSLNRYGQKSITTVNYSNAIRFYQKGCDNGDLDACSNLGIRYFHAQGVQQDYAKAKELFTKTCMSNQPIAIACFNLGVMYVSGRGVAKDETKAKELFNKACDSGLSEGCKNYEILKKKGQAK